MPLRAKQLEIQQEKIFRENRNYSMRRKLTVYTCHVYRHVCRQTPIHIKCK